MIPGALFIVYSLTNKKTGRKYYGRTKNPYHREKEHNTQLDTGWHYNNEMQRDHEPGGWEFTRLVENLGQKEANKVSDQLAKNDPTTYNQLGIVPSCTRFRRALKKDDADAIRSRYFNDGYTQNEIAKMYGVTQGLISLTVNGLLHNIRGEQFTPPERFVPEEFEPGREFKEALRARANEFKHSISHFKILTRLSKEFKLDKRCVNFWLRNDEGRSNLTHAPVTHRYTVNGEPCYNLREYARKHKINARHIIIQHGEYVTLDQRTVLLDGEKVLIGDRKPHAVLREKGLLPAVRVAEFEYVTKPSAKTRKNPEVTAALKEIAKARKALENPVRAKRSGRILVQSTLDKYQCDKRVFIELMSAERTNLGDKKD